MLGSERTILRWNGQGWDATNTGALHESVQPARNDRERIAAGPRLPVLEVMNRPAARIDDEDRPDRMVMRDGTLIDTTLPGSTSSM